jgi:hypothetical protein
MCALPQVNLKQKEPYVAKLVANYDEQLKADASGMSLVGAPSM